MIDPGHFASLLLSAFLVGLLGAGHCTAMCGGFVSAFAMSGNGGARRPLHHLINYNLGRISSYALAGALAGMFGSVSLHLFEVETARLVSRLLVACTLVAVGLYLLGIPQLLAPLERLGYRLWSRVSPRFTHLLQVRHAFDAFKLGLVWGWLPCGLVYSALLSALTTGDPLMGAQVMLFFGLGTLPALISLGLVAVHVRRLSTSNLFRRGAGATLSLLGLLALMGPAHH